MSTAPRGKRIFLPIFPLPNLVLFPTVSLPLHIFEPRYRALVRDAMLEEGVFLEGHDARLIPGVMGTEQSGIDESFAGGLLEYPQYTRPATFEGQLIPDVLTGGDHAKVEAWRRAEAERLTRERRPDLWAAYQSRPKTPKS